MLTNWFTFLLYKFLKVGLSAATLWPCLLDLTFMLPCLPHGAPHLLGHPHQAWLTARLIAAVQMTRPRWS